MNFTVKRKILNVGLGKPLPVIWTTKWLDGATVRARRFEFDYSIESDGQLWVYVYTYGESGVRRIPMGNYRKANR